MSDPSTQVLALYDSIRGLWSEDEAPSWPEVQDQLLKLIDIHTVESETIRSAKIAELRAPDLVWETDEDPELDYFPSHGSLTTRTPFGTYSIGAVLHGECVWRNEGLNLYRRVSTQEEAVTAVTDDYNQRVAAFLASLR